MAFFLGPGVKAGIEIHKNNQLKKQIEFQNKVKENTILDLFQGEQRFVIANELTDSLIQIELEKEDLEKETINDYLENLNKEFNMVKSSTSNHTSPNEQNIQKTQLFALGLAIKELSIGLEQEKRLIKSLEEQFQSDLSNTIAENNTLHQQAITQFEKEKKSLISDMENQISLLQETSNKLEKGINQNLEQNNATIKTYLDEEKSAIHSLSERIEKELTNFINQSTLQHQENIKNFSLEKAKVINEFQQEVITFRENSKKLEENIRLRLQHSSELLQTQLTTEKVGFQNLARNLFNSINERFSENIRVTNDIKKNLIQSNEIYLQNIKTNTTQQLQEFLAIQTTIQSENAKKNKYIWSAIILILLIQILGFGFLFFSNRI